MGEMEENGVTFNCIEDKPFRLVYNLGMAQGFIIESDDKTCSLWEVEGFDTRPEAEARATELNITINE